MTTTFETSRHIDAPPERVWEVLSDVVRWPEWTPTIDRVEPEGDGPLVVGAQYTVRQPRLPQAVWKVAEVVQGRSFTWRAEGPGIRTVGRHEVVPDATGSTVVLGIDQAGPMGTLAAWVWRRLTQRYIELEADSLARRVSHDPAA
jgi:uncharacterized protein YndB with AHSA1/START domain